MTHPLVADQDDPAPQQSLAEKRRTSPVVLSIVVVLLGITGVLGYLYLNAKASTDTLTTQVAELDRRQGEVGTKAQESADLLSSAVTAQGIAENAQRTAESAGRMMAQCQKFAQEMRDADLGGGSTETFQVAGRNLFDTC